MLYFVHFITAVKITCCISGWWLTCKPFDGSILPEAKFLEKVLSNDLILIKENTKAIPKYNNRIKYKSWTVFKTLAF